MRILLLLSILVVLASGKRKEPAIDKAEARNAFLYLNEIRTAPQKHLATYPFLATYKKMPALKWNDTLAKLAEAKALDMATRNYFAHVDPDGFGMNYYIHKAGYRIDSNQLRKPTANAFESCQGGGLSYKEVIRSLLEDTDTPSLMHRHHLLGTHWWTGSLKDIGIGYVKAGEGKMFRTFTCILIAKHPE